MKGFIYNQKDIPSARWRYGLRSSAATGCGWIATYNALRMMGYYAKPEDLIRWYERSFPVINGNFGTFLYSPVAFFKRKGFRVHLVIGRKNFDRAVRECDAAILFYYWRKRYKFGSHFVAVQYRCGNYIGYNTFRASAGEDDYGPSLKAFLKRQGLFCPVLIAVKDRSIEREQRGRI